MALDSWNFSRFLANLIELEETLELVSWMNVPLPQDLREALPHFSATYLGCDGKAIESHSNASVNSATGECSDPDADWGKYEITGIDTHCGEPGKKIKSWFGYGLHMIADTRYEIPVAVHVTPASASE